MKLKTGNLYWPAMSSPLVTSFPLTSDVKTEVVVLGAGVTGAFTACLLAEAGVDVTIVDQRGVAEGSTPASTALIQYEIDTPLVKLAEKVGVQAAQTAYRASRTALTDIAELVARHGIECELNWTGSLFLSASAKDFRWFEAEAHARRAIGIEVELLNRKELRQRFDLDRSGALHSPAAMTLDPFKLTHGLFTVATKLGARLFHAEVTPEGLHHGKQRIVASNGHAILADQVVIATGYETPEQFSKVRKYCRLTSTYALASETLEGPAWPGGVVLWESGSPYFYSRHTPDGRVIIGGEDEEFANPEARDALIDSKIDTLLKKFKKLRPGVEVAPEYCWAGTFAESNDGMPLIGQFSEYPRCHFALGYGGNGITFALLAAQIIRDSILGRPGELAKVFRFDR